MESILTILESKEHPSHCYERTVIMLHEEAKVFRQEKHRLASQARQRVAFQLMTGIDLSEALAAEGEKRALILQRLSRLIERERLKGVNNHWSYDLNRHIALKQALDRFYR